MATMETAFHARSLLPVLLIQTEIKHPLITSTHKAMANKGKGNDPPYKGIFSKFTPKLRLRDHLFSYECHNCFIFLLLPRHGSFKKQNREIEMQNSAVKRYIVAVHFGMLHLSAPNSKVIKVNDSHQTLNRLLLLLQSKCISQNISLLAHKRGSVGNEQ